MYNTYIIYKTILGLPSTMRIPNKSLFQYNSIGDTMGL